MRNQFTTPFNPEFEKDKLCNLVSGRPVPEDIANSLLSLDKKGLELYEEFRKRLSGNAKESFSATLPRNKTLKTFKDTALKVQVSSKHKVESMKIERDVLVLLLAESNRSGCPIDIDGALCYPLNPVPPSLCTADGGRRKATKSDLLHVLGDMQVDADDDVRNDCDVYMEDLAAFVRSSVSQCSNIRDLSTLLIKSKPSTCKRFYVMIDSYEDEGIKSGERKMRGTGERYVLNNLDMKIPYDINNFLSVGENKKNLFELIQRGVEEQELGETKVFFSKKGSMTELSNNTKVERSNLACNHIEADYMFALYCRMEDDVLIRSRSGDIDIIVSLVGHEDLPTSVYLDNGTGSRRSLIQPSLSELCGEEKAAIIGFHALSGNDYLGSFFRKGKKTCWKIAKRCKEFMLFFSKLGLEDDCDQLMAAAESYVCALYGKPKLKDVNEARSKIFWDKYKKKNKIIELSLLPPCKRNLYLHVKRANYVAKIMRSDSRIVDNEFTQHGWTESGEPIWTNEHVPENIQEILMSSPVAQSDDPEELLVDNEDEDEDVELEDFS
jgi:hypothetical protein